FSQAPPAGTAAEGSFNPSMIGDQLGGRLCGPIIATIPGQGQVVLVPGGGQTFPPGTTFNVPAAASNGTTSFVLPAGQPLTAAQAALVASIGGFQVGQLPPCASAASIIARGAFKIADNESPRPQDRVFLTYNYFNNINGSLNPPGAGQTDGHRELLGFEKTFLGGDASFELRLPFLQLTGDPGGRDTGIGDLTLILKYALINDRPGGNCVSAGLALTLPTGNNFAPEGIPSFRDDVLFQPFVGYILARDQWYVHGFTSLVVPTNG